MPMTSYASESLSRLSVYAAVECFEIGMLYLCVDEAVGEGKGEYGIAKVGP